MQGILFSGGMGFYIKLKRTLLHRVLKRTRQSTSSVLCVDVSHLRLSLRRGSHTIEKKHTQKGSATSVIIFTTSQIVRRSAIERIPSAFNKNSPSGAHRPPPHPRQGEKAQYIKLVAAAVTWRIIIARQILTHTHTHTDTIIHSHLQIYAHTYTREVSVFRVESALSAQSVLFVVRRVGRSGCCKCPT